MVEYGEDRSILCFHVHPFTGEAECRRPRNYRRDVANKGLDCGSIGSPRRAPINFVRWAPGFYNAVVKLRRKAGSAGDCSESMLVESWLRASLTAAVLVAVVHVS